MNSSSEGWKRKIPQVVACLLAANGAFIAGTNLGWSNQSQSRLVKQREYDLDISDEQFSWISALLPLGGAIGALCCSPIVKRLGRKMSIIALLVPFILGWCLLLAAVDVSMLLAGRFILGLCVGAYTVVVPIYIGEVAEKDIRGTLGGLFQLFIVIGIMFSFAIGAQIRVFHAGLLFLLIPLVYMVPFLFMPDSPIYLVESGKIEAAVKSIRFFYGSKVDVEEMLDELTADAENSKNLTWELIREELKLFAVKYALVIGIGLQAFQQLSGINAVIFYSTEIFMKSAASMSAHTCTNIVGFIQIIATIIALAVVDKMGRKCLLIISGVVMSLCTCLLGGYFFVQENNQKAFDAIPSYLPVVLICIFIAVFCLGFGPVTWIVMGEIFTPAAKEFACGLAVFTNWMLAFTVTKTFVNLVNLMGAGATFWIFSFISMLAAVFVWVVLVETKELTIKEITEKIERRKM